jgi:hypothetical protein
MPSYSLGLEMLKDAVFRNLLFLISHVVSHILQRTVTVYKDSEIFSKISLRFTIEETLT